MFQDVLEQMFVGIHPLNLERLQCIQRVLSRNLEGSIIMTRGEHNKLAQQRVENGTVRIIGEWVFFTDG